MMTTEQGALRLSIAVTFALAVFGIALGLVTGSGAIVFDGIYSFLDTMTATLMLLVARLIATSTSRSPDARLVERFTMGFWHLEPMVVGLTGMLLLGSAAYAFVTAVDSLLKGGRMIETGLAQAYAVVGVLAALAMVMVMRRANRRLRSNLLAIDISGWQISAAMTAALLTAFVIAGALEGTRLGWILPYVDPVVLALVSLIVLPVPIPMLRQSLSEILLVTPAALKAEVDSVASGIAARHGFSSWRSYVARVGRGTQIELYFIVPRGEPPRRLEDWDAIRDRIGAEIGGEGPHRWLTIAFTTDVGWAE